jgi:AP2 domain
LDNQRSNLRECSVTVHNGTKGKQPFNTSGFKGVTFYKRLKTRPWRADIMVNRKSISLGYFPTPTDAAVVYDAAARQVFGPTACTNASLGLV